VHYVVQHDLATPERWLASQRRSRSRRLVAARQAARRRLGRRGVVALVAAMSLGTGAAVAASGGASSSSATQDAKPTVAAIQQALGVTADGVTGPRTRRAIKRFQRRNGLTADGIAGPATLDALGLTDASPAADDETLDTSSDAGAATDPDAAAVLAKIAECESGGDPAAVSATGQYRGKYQFSRATWRALGGKGDPAKAPESVQDAIAAKLLAQRGTTPWPVCG
jgi:hypothetical protein